MTRQDKTNMLLKSQIHVISCFEILLYVAWKIVAII